MSVRVDEQRVVAGADILVGVPCYKDGSMVDQCLRSLEETGVQLLVVDNGSAPDVRRAISGRGIVLLNNANRYVNPAWNQLMQWFLGRPARYDLLVLANSDLRLVPGWSAKLRAHRQIHRHEQLIFGIDAQRRRKSAGTFFAMTRRMVTASYPIPDDLLIMGGDDFIFHVGIGLGYEEYVVDSVTMSHVERGTYDKSPEVWDIARRDTNRWNTHVFRDLVPRRIKEFLPDKKTPRAFYEHVHGRYALHLEGCSVCKQSSVCAACASGAEGGHACNCYQEGGGRGYRLRRLWGLARRTVLWRARSW